MLKQRGPGTSFVNSIRLRDHSHRIYAVFIMVTNFVLSVRPSGYGWLCHGPLADGPPSSADPWLCPCSSSSCPSPAKIICPLFGACASVSESFCRLRSSTSGSGCSPPSCKYVHVCATARSRLTALSREASGRAQSRVSLCFHGGVQTFTQFTERVPYGLVLKRYWRPLIGTCGAW